MQFDVVVIGSGMGALSAAALLSADGLKVAILEQNWLPGGCTSAYWRKGFVFEAGATTLVGLDEGMPLQAVLQRTGIRIDAVPLQVPMQVHLANGQSITRHQNLNEWIAEAERVFGKEGQRPFWEFCYKVSQFVWRTSLKQTAFPPTSATDLLQCALRVTPKQLHYAAYAFFSTEWLLKKFNLHRNSLFVDFVNEQLLITAQNYAPQVNVLFGATALCYTNYGNYYVNGGLINLVRPFVDFIEQRGGKIFLRHKAVAIVPSREGYVVRALFKGKQETDFRARFVISGIPINNTLPLFRGDVSPQLKKRLLRLQKQVMGAAYLNSAFQIGIGFRPHKPVTCLHHQIHLREPLPETGSASIFLSFNHPNDHSRSDLPGLAVASVSTHVPQCRTQLNKQMAEQAVVQRLAELDLLQPENIVYMHASTPAAWEKWTQRAFGFVGGYPQYIHIKPWQMLDARLDGKRAYICGDTTYPGQGIPGVVLSGMIAYEKLKRDWL
ncbi:MAG: FAD-dependent oxidoreductase [Cytophagales bacterium]|nr:FAD-dependent oxidoreductase [Bernardetiaceae bacterium]MDW8204415.1 FAD-dependent oxidoreductase [Cytophagales bacterium]